MEVEVELGGNRGPDGRHHRAERPRPPVRFTDHDELFFAAHLDGERGPGVGGQLGVAPAHGPLDVLRIKVASPDDDQIFQPTGDEQLASAYEPKITGPKVPRTGIVIRRKAGLKGARGRSGLVPVPPGNARTRHPDLADPVVGQPGLVLGIDDEHLMIAGEPARTDHEASRRSGGVHRRDFTLIEGGRIDLQLDGRCRRWPTADDQGRFRQAIARQKGFAAEPTRRKCVGEPVDRLRPDRLSAVERDGPAAEVEPLLLLGGHPAGAEVVGEVRTTADRGAGPADQLQPANRPLQERHRREQGGRPAAVEGLQRAADQPHVVVQGEPRNPSTRSARPETLLDDRRVAQEVAVADDDSPGRRR